MSHQLTFIVEKDALTPVSMKNVDFSSGKCDDKSFDAIRSCVIHDHLIAQPIIQSKKGSSSYFSDKVCLNKNYSTISKSII